jgi:hypothetical protein
MCFPSHQITNLKEDTGESRPIGKENYEKGFLNETKICSTTAVPVNITVISQTKRKKIILVHVNNMQLKKKIFKPFQTRKATINQLNDVAVSRGTGVVKKQNYNFSLKVCATWLLCLPWPEAHGWRTDKT